MNKKNNRSHSWFTIEIAFHIMGWVLLFGSPLMMMDREHAEFNSRLWLHMQIVPIAILATFYINYLLLVPKLLIKKHHHAYLTAAFATVIGVFALMHIVMALDGPPAFHPHKIKVAPFWIFWIKDFIVLAFVSIFAALTQICKRWSKAETEKQEAEAARHEAELSNLRNQINPHFLLNTLNNIYALISFNTDKAQFAVRELSRLLRHMLYENQQEMVSLDSELDFVHNYIELMRLRLNANVTVKVDIENENNHNQVAPLIFISLIENAFKHGVSPTQHSFINIYIHGQQNGIINCQITNSNHPKASTDRSGNGIGLEQVKKRLELMYKGNYQWTQQVNPQNQCFESTLTLYKATPCTQPSTLKTTN